MDKIDNKPYHARNHESKLFEKVKCRQLEKTAKENNITRGY